MSLRKDLIKISEKEGFDCVEDFVRFFIVDGNRTFMELKLWLEQKYRRYYSWVWVYTWCSPMVPQYRVSKRERLINVSGLCNSLVEKQWDEKAQAIGRLSIDMVFREWVGPLPALAQRLGVKYMTLYSRYRKWEKINNGKP